MIGVANKNPVQSEGFKAMQAPKYGDRALGKTIGIRFPADVDEVLRGMSDRQEFIREAVREALVREGLI